MILYKCIFHIAILMSTVFSDVLDTERSSFFGFTHEIAISTSTLELVEQLGNIVMEYKEGDRIVRRYFDRYDTPFVGAGRRKG